MRATCSELDMIWKIAYSIRFISNNILLKFFSSFEFPEFVIYYLVYIVWLCIIYGHWTSKYTYIFPLDRSKQGLVKKTNLTLLPILMWVDEWHLHWKFGHFLRRQDLIMCIWIAFSIWLTLLLRFFRWLTAPPLTNKMKRIMVRVSIKISKPYTVNSKRRDFFC